MTNTEKQLIAHLLYKRIEELENESFNVLKDDYMDVNYRQAVYAFIQKELGKYKELFIKWSK